MLSSRLVSIYQCQTASRREAGARARARACRGGRDRGRKWVWPSEEEERSRAGGGGDYKGKVRAPHASVRDPSTPFLPDGIKAL